MKRTYTAEQQADLDVKTSENLIGDIINLGQCLNSMIWDGLNSGATLDEVMPVYLDAAQLDVMSGVEIDKAKKEFSFSNSSELRKMRKKYENLDEDGKQIKPHFFKFLSMQKGYPQTGTKAYQKHETTMDYLHSIVNGYTSKGLATPEATMRFSEILDSGQYNKSGPNNAQVQRVISLVEECDCRIKAIYANPDPDYSTAAKAADAELVREECSEYIGNIKFNYNTCIRLLRMVELEQYGHIRRRLFSILFGYPNTMFFEYIQHGKEDIHSMERDRRGDREFYGMRFRNT